MLSKLLTLITGRDDLERVANKNDFPLLCAYLETRRVLVPRQPKRFLDAGSYTPDQLVEAMEAEMSEWNSEGDQFYPWIIEIDGKKHLPIFSQRKRLETFRGHISKQLDKVFPLGAEEFLVHDMVQKLRIDVLHLNMYSKRRWEVAFQHAPIVA